MDFVYIPVKRPPPASPLRQVAYRNWTSLVGVEGDPEGWHTVEPVIIKGNLFGDHQVEVQCTVSEMINSREDCAEISRVIACETSE